MWLERFELSVIRVDKQVLNHAAMLKAQNQEMYSESRHAWVGMPDFPLWTSLYC